MWRSRPYETFTNPGTLSPLWFIVAVFVQHKHRGKRDREAAVQPRFLCKRRRMSSWKGRRKTRTGLLLVVFPSDNPSVFRARRRSRRQWLHCFVPLTVTDTGGGVNVKQMYFPTFFSLIHGAFYLFSRDGYCCFDTLRLWKIHRWRVLAYRNAARMETCDYLHKKWLQFSGAQEWVPARKRGHLAAESYSIFMNPFPVCVRRKDAAVLTDRMELLKQN